MNLLCVWHRYITYSELSVCLSTGPVPIGAHVGTTPALVPAPTDAAPGADLVAGDVEGAIAVPPCQIVAGTLATGYVFSASPTCID